MRKQATGSRSFFEKKELKKLLSACARGHERTGQLPLDEQKFFGSLFFKKGTACLAFTSFLLSTAAIAAPACTPEALTKLNIPGVTITAAAEVPAADGQPAHCRVQGSVITTGEGAGDGRAGFVMQLPASWQQRYFFMGVGGNAGNFTPSANPADRAIALGKGYATIVTDTGHTGDGTTAEWTVDAAGKPNQVTRIDFFYRAAHVVTGAGKQLAAAFYGAPVQHAYFDGCSTGGRMAMMEAERYPDDYDGIIAGDPAMDYRSQIGRILVQKAQLSSPAAYIPASLLPMIDKAVAAQCDAKDGVKDGLVQNPATCHFKSEALLCKAGATADCLSAPQVQTLKTYLAPLRDSAGHAIYPGMSPTDLAGPRGMPAWTIGLTDANLADTMAPWGNKAPAGWNYARQAISYWLTMGPQVHMNAYDADPVTGRIGKDALRHFDAVFAGAVTKDPARLERFVEKGRKMIMYHGFSDPAISPFRTTQFYREFAARRGGYAKAQANVRLFMVPGMAHCSAGPGPEHFDTLTPLEAWVEKGIAPDSILATATFPGATKRTMPLCQFPEQAAYKGTGDINEAANWSCTANTRLLEVAGK
jgi:feruloyl esterase